MAFCGPFLCIFFVISQAYIWNILGISLVYLSHIFGISFAYLGHIRSISWAYPKHILETPWSYLGHILVIYWVHFGSVQQITGFQVILYFFNLLLNFSYLTHPVQPGLFYKHLCLSFIKTTESVDICSEHLHSQTVRTS